MKKPRVVTRALKGITGAEWLTERQQKTFVKRSSSVFNNMRARLQKSGKEIPFSLPQFRSWSLPKLLQKNCIYCQKTITFGNFSVDHATPLSRGGTISFDNLQILDSDCNLSKGIMTVEEFENLFYLMNTWPSEIKNETLGRLRVAAKLRNRIFKKPAAA